MFGLRLTKRDITIAAVIFATTFCIYLFSAWYLGKIPSPVYAYFDELASSFLRGHLYLDHPNSKYDLTFYQGRWYVPFLPLPAFLMAPWIAIFGSIDATLFLAAFGALNVSFVFLIIRALTIANWTQLQMMDSLWLAVLFGFGSVHWYVTRIGSVWLVSQICTVAFVAISLWLAIAARAPFFAGLALGAAMWARPHIILLYPLILGIGYQESHEMDSASKRSFLVQWGWRSIVPLFLAVAGILVYNWLRFDNPLDFGYQTQNVNPALREELSMYGQFSLHFVPHNLWTMLLAMPQWDSARQSFFPSREGMSVFITSPAFLYLVRARQRSAVVLGAWLSVLLVLIPLMTYYNTGWDQFGYRFSLDFMVPLIILLAYANQDRLSILMRLLILASVGVNTWGIIWFQ